MSTLAGQIGTGILLPDRVLFTDSFKILATFVALNTLMYAALALLKLVPRKRLGARPRGRNRRRENRSIYPDPGEEGVDRVPGMVDAP